VQPPKRRSDYIENRLSVFYIGMYVYTAKIKSEQHFNSQHCNICTVLKGSFVHKVVILFLNFPAQWHLNIVKTVYKGHSREPENVLFIYRLKLYVLFIIGKNKAVLYRQ